MSSKFYEGRKEYLGLGFGFGSRVHKQTQTKFKVRVLDPAFFRMLPSVRDEPSLVFYSDSKKSA